MNSNKCEHIMDSFYSLDKGEKLPFSSTLHLFACKDCRTKVRYLTKAEKIAKKPLREIMEFRNDELEAVKNSMPDWMNKVKPVSMKKWIVCGLVMIVFLIGSGQYIEQYQNESYLFWFYILFAFTVTSYCAAFMAANMDFFIKKIDTRNAPKIICD